MLDFENNREYVPKPDETTIYDWFQRNRDKFLMWPWKSIKFDGFWDWNVRFHVFEFKFQCEITDRNICFQLKLNLDFKISSNNAKTIEYRLFKKLNFTQKAIHETEDNTY